MPERCVGTRSRANSACRRWRSAAALLAFALFAIPGSAQSLNSWNDGPARQAIVRFVTDVTTPGAVVRRTGGPRRGLRQRWGALVRAADVLPARVRDRPGQGARAGPPEWKDTQPLEKQVLEGDVKALAASGERGLLELVMATHAGMTSDEFALVVREWAKTARHPTLRRPYTELTLYAPMRELLNYLRASGFRTYIVSGGGVEFLRVLAEELYGVPPEQVIGSSIRTRYEVRDGRPVIVPLPEIEFIDDKAGKPVGIHKFVGRRPIAAFGNSDGDFEMLEWTTSGPGRRLGLIVHHDDEAREFAYDRASAIGRLNRALNKAGRRGWVVVSMRNDWRNVYAPAR